MPNEEEVDELTDIALQSVSLHLRSDELPARIVEGSIVIGQVGGTDLLCRCWVLPTSPDLHSAIVPVAIDVSYSHPDSTDDRTIGDMVVGLSDDPRAAVVHATHTWCAGVFPPIRRAFDPRPASKDEDDNAYPFQIAAQDVETGAISDWDLFLGLAKVGGPDTEIFASFLAEGKLVHLLLNTLLSVTHDKRLHWVKVYVAFQPDGSATFEAKLDSFDWPEGTTALSNIAWPKVQGFLQYRQFLVMRPSSTPHEDVRQHLDEALKQAEPAHPMEPPPKRRPWWPFNR